MQITLRNVKSQLSECPLELEEKLSVLWPDYWHYTKYKEGTWDGKTHFLDMKTGKFPTGLLHIVTGWCIENDIDYHTINVRPNPIEIDVLKDVDANMLTGITLRDDQLQAITNSIIHCRGVIQMPTGTGKTEVAIALTKLLDLPTLFLVNSKSLLHQTQERFIKRLTSDKEEIGIFGDSIFEPGSHVTVATVQSLDHMKKKGVRKFGQFMNKFRVIMMDECHHASAQTWYTAGMWAHNAYYRFGFSGTPMDRSDKDSMKLMAVVGDTIYKRKTEDAINDGDLCPIEMYMLDNEEEVTGYSWQDIYRYGIVMSHKRNSQIADIAIEHYKKHDKVLILVRQLLHGENLKSALDGWPVMWLHGKHGQRDREEAIRWFNEGQGILIASGIFDEGIDIPEINVLIVASGGKSDVKSIQRIGRGLRKKAGGGALTAYDFYDSSKYLDKHSHRRKEVYRREGYLK